MAWGSYAGFGVLKFEVFRQSENLLKTLETLGLKG